MNDDQFSRLGKDIKDAVNSALGSMDFSGLNAAISGTVDRAVHEAANVINDAFGGKPGRGGSSGGADGRSGRGFAVRLGRQAEGWQLPGRISGMLMTIFGSICCVGFGIPMLVLLAVGLGMHVSVPLMLSLVAFLPLTLISGLVLKMGIGRLCKVKRFGIYKRCIGRKAICAVRTLSSAVAKPEQFVCRELEELIAAGYFPQGHLDDERSCIMTDDETYQLYLQAKQRVKEAKANVQKDAAGRKAWDAAGEKIFTGEKALSPEEKRLKEALDAGMEYIQQIRRINDELPEEMITRKLSHLEQVIGLIYLRVQKTPEKLGSLKRFTDYYLPTTLRLVETYRELDESLMQTDNIRESKKQIEDTLDTINAAFDKLLDSLYEEDRMNIQTDITVLQTLLAQEGLTEDELHSVGDSFGMGSTGGMPGL